MQVQGQEKHLCIQKNCRSKKRYIGTYILNGPVTAVSQEIFE